jgi:hypothetical protein
MVVVQEFYLDIKPTKLIKGQGLCKLGIEAQDLINEDLGWENELALWSNEYLYIPPAKEYWYGKLISLLHHGTFLENLSPKKRRALRPKYAQYHLVNSTLFCINYNGVLLRCLKHEDAKKVLRDLHDTPAGGNFVRDTKTHKILRADYYWPTVFRDTHTYTRNYKSC